MQNARKTKTELLGELKDLRHDHAELGQKEQALQVSLERYRNLIEGSIQGIFVHRNNKALFANETCAQLYGYESAEEFMKLESLLHLIHPDELKKLLGYQKARLAGNPAPSRYEFRGRRKDGSAIWLEHLVSKVDWDEAPAIQSTVIDITQRKQAEEALRESESRIRKFTNSAPVFLSYIDHEFRLRVANRTYTERLGKTEDEVIGASVEELLGAEAFTLILPYA